MVAATSSAAIAALGLPVRNGSISTVVCRRRTAKAGVAEKPHFHRHQSSCVFVVSLARKPSSRASSNPTATPTSIPSRVSSASSVSNLAHALAWDPPGRPPRAPPGRGRVKPAALVERQAQHALERGRGPRDQILGLAQSLRLGQRGDRRIELGIGVGAVGHSVQASYVGDGIALTSLSHGAGCGCKLPAAAIGPLLAGLPAPPNPNVLVGFDTSDDAGVVPGPRRPRDRQHGRLLHPDRRRPVRLRADRGHQRAVGHLRDGRVAGQRAEPGRVLVR